MLVPPLAKGPHLTHSFRHLSKADFLFPMQIPRRPKDLGMRRVIIFQYTHLLALVIASNAQLILCAPVSCKEFPETEPCPQEAY